MRLDSRCPPPAARTPPLLHVAVAVAVVTATLPSIRRYRYTPPIPHRRYRRHCPPPLAPLAPPVRAAAAPCHPQGHPPQLLLHASVAWRADAYDDGFGSDDDDDESDSAASSLAFCIDSLDGMRRVALLPGGERTPIAPAVVGDVAEGEAAGVDGKEEEVAFRRRLWARLAQRWRLTESDYQMRTLLSGSLCVLCRARSATFLQRHMQRHAFSAILSVPYLSVVQSVVPRTLYIRHVRAT